jgi:hypothetical protein
LPFYLFPEFFGKQLKPADAIPVLVVIKTVAMIKKMIPNRHSKIISICNLIPMSEQAQARTIKK